MCKAVVFGAYGVFVYLQLGMVKHLHRWGRGQVVGPGAAHCFVVTGRSSFSKKDRPPGVDDEAAIDYRPFELESSGRVKIAANNIADDAPRLVKAKSNSAAPFSQIGRSTTKTGSFHEEGISACLLIRDDNGLLIEWLAYHYHVLPLRHLIIAVDPDSKTSPMPILRRWDDTQLQYVVWQDEDFLSNSKMTERKQQTQLAFNSNNTIADLTQLHDERQRLFLRKCYKHHKMLDHKWVAHIDTDEFVLFNVPGDGEPFMDNNTHSTLKPNPARKWLPQIGEATINEVIKKTDHGPCVAMIRLLFGPMLTDESTMIQLQRLTPEFNPSHFTTLKYPRHIEKGIAENAKTKMVNGLGKVIIDVSRIRMEDFNSIFSIHRPFKNLCPANHLGPQPYLDSIFRVNHYLGSWEAYSAKGDSRRKRETFDLKAAVSSSSGPSFNVHAWLPSFIKEVGIEQARQLLEGIGKSTLKSALETGTNGTSHSSCAILFFGLGRKMKDVAFPAIQEYIFDANPNCDVFVHTYIVMSARGRQGYEDGKGLINPAEMMMLCEPANIMFETESDFQRQRNVSYYRTLFPRPSYWDYPASMDNMIRQWHSLHQVWGLMESHEESVQKKYSRVGLFRPDVLYTHPINIGSEDAVIPSMMYEPTQWGGYNDRMFYGLRSYAETWATGRFMSVDSYLKWQMVNTNTSKQYGLHSEDFMRYLLTERFKIPVSVKDICFQRIRTSGLTLTTDCELMKSDIQHRSSQHNYSSNDEALPGVVVLGMHRSGTSMLSGLLVGALSLKVPGPHVSAAVKGQNPKGFFENNDVALQNEAWLEEQGMSWSELGMRTKNGDPTNVVGGFDASLVRSVGQHGVNAVSLFNDIENQPWVLKDPRLCLTFPIWISLLDGAAPPVVFTYRNPLEVAMSLQARKRNSVPLLKALKLWIWYNREAIRLSKNMCRVVTSNTAILKAPKKEVRRLRTELGNCGIQLKAVDYSKANEFVDSGLQHNTNNKALSCTSPEFAEGSNAAAEHRKNEIVCKKAMRVFIDMENRQAFLENYTWPTLGEDYL